MSNLNLFSSDYMFKLCGVRGSAAVMMSHEVVLSSLVWNVSISYPDFGCL